VPGAAAAIVDPTALGPVAVAISPAAVPDAPVAHTPEPATFFLMGTAFGTMLLARRRNRRRSQKND
jgi:hypothetical protein